MVWEEEKVLERAEVRAAEQRKGIDAAAPCT